MRQGQPTQRWAAVIAQRLRDAGSALSAQFADSASGIACCVLDELLPEADARLIHESFPDPRQMRLRDSFRERKYVSAQMDRHAPPLQAALFAFHEADVVEQVRAIVGKPDLQPDPQLYAGGVSLMGRGHFLNPHIDNSHDGERRRWRNLNLLYYVTPDWDESGGGELELWPAGVGGPVRGIAPRFNRLVIMATHQQAWHSVRPITSPVARCCVSNYYFGDSPMRADQAFHVTSFRARPEQPLRDWLSRADSALRMGIRKIRPQGLAPTDHIYRR